MNRLPFFLSCLVLTWVVSPALAQIEIAYVDSEYIYSRYPEFATAQQQLDRLTAQWTSELENRQAEVDQQFREYQARELLYTQDERQRKQEEIMQAGTGPQQSAHAVLRAGRGAVPAAGSDAAPDTGEGPDRRGDCGHCRGIRLRIWIAAETTYFSTPTTSMTSATWFSRNWALR